MDISEFLNMLKNASDFVLSRFYSITRTWTELQWMFFIVGIVLLIISIIQAVRAKRIFTYKIATWGVKISFMLIVLAFAWPYAVDLYNTAMGIFGNPVLSFIIVLGGGIFGYNIIKLLLERKRT